MRAVDELMALNPSLLRMATPPPGILSGPFDLHLPPGTATLFQQRVADIPTRVARTGATTALLRTTRWQALRAAIVCLSSSSLQSTI